MNHKIVGILIPLLFTGSASAQSLYLACTPLSGPEPQYTTLYKVPPPDTRKQFMRDMMMEGLTFLLYPRPESWVVNISENRIFSPEDSGFFFKNPAITEARISAEHDTGAGIRYSYDLNRITGKLTYRANLNEEIVSAWRNKYGGTLPAIWRWEHKCLAAPKPAL